MPLPRPGHQSRVAFPRGFVLKLILFIICINDIDVGLNNSVSKFADDMKIENSIIENLRKISEWFERWEMPINVKKCHFYKWMQETKNLIMRGTG